MNRYRDKKYSKHELFKDEPIQQFQDISNSNYYV